MDKLANQLSKTIEQHDKRFKAINLNERYVCTEINMETENKDKIIVSGTVISVKTELKAKYYRNYRHKQGLVSRAELLSRRQPRSESWFSWIPIFLKEPISEGQFFTVAVKKLGDRRFAVGLATVDIKDTTDEHNSRDSIYLNARGRLHSSRSDEKKKLL